MNPDQAMEELCITQNHEANQKQALEFFNTGMKIQNLLK